MTIPALLTLTVGLCLAGYVAFIRYDDSTRAAERRWRANNSQAKAAGCPCGKPAEVVREDHGTLGRVPAETWTCRDHAGASMWVGDGKTMTPSWPRTAPCQPTIADGGRLGCKGMCGRSGPIGGPTTQWHCPTKPGSEAAA